MIRVDVDPVPARTVTPGQSIRTGEQGPFYLVKKTEPSPAGCPQKIHITLEDRRRWCFEAEGPVYVE